MSDALVVQDLRVSFPGPAGRAFPVNGVSLTVRPGELLALVGESGSGKTLTGMALLRLVPAPGRIESGSVIRLGDTDLLALEGDALRRVRGRRLAMVFQDPLASLNPVLCVGAQIAETVRAHFVLPRREARQRAEALLAEVGIADPARHYSSYPHQLSGGMRQRAMLAIALAAQPELLIADEPTSALDVTVQAQILQLLDRLRTAHGMSLLLITHDLSIVAGRADRVAVMHAGQIVETARTADLFAHPGSGAARQLLETVPRLRGAQRVGPAGARA